MSHTSPERHKQLQLDLRKSTRQAYLHMPLNLALGGQIFESSRAPELHNEFQDS